MTNGTNRITLAPSRQDRLGLELQEVTNAMVRIYKELLGRGPTKARSAYAGPDTLVATLEDSLTSAERNLIRLGEHQRVRETRTLFQHASEHVFVEAVEQITGRRVRAFVSGTDTHKTCPRRSSTSSPLASPDAIEGGSGG